MSYNLVSALEHVCSTLHLLKRVSAAEEIERSAAKIELLHTTARL